GRVVEGDVVVVGRDHLRQRLVGRLLVAHHLLPGVLGDVDAGHLADGHAPFLVAAGRHGRHAPQLERLGDGGRPGGQLVEAVVDEVVVGATAAPAPVPGQPGRLDAVLAGGGQGREAVEVEVGGVAVQVEELLGLGDGP